jgi:1-acyl-sn-glycerol-3-phosphate acyltransferase
MLAPAVITLTVVVLLTLPVWLLVAAALSPLLPGRLRGLRVLWVAVVALVLESAALVALLLLWIASGYGLLLRTSRFQQLHYRLVAGYLAVLYHEATRVLGLRVEVEGPRPDEYLGRPLLVFCRHAGPGDSLLLIHVLVNWYAREPRIVLAGRLQWDPALDVALNRLPNRFVAGGGDDVERRIGELATALDRNDAFVIFPEGGNFTERRRVAAIARLRVRGLEEMARRSEAMRHVLAPHPGGVAAALAAARKRTSSGWPTPGWTTCSPWPTSGGSCRWTTSFACGGGGCRARTCRRGSTHRWNGSTGGGRRSTTGWTALAARPPPPQPPCVCGSGCRIDYRARDGGHADRHTTPSPRHAGHVTPAAAAKAARCCVPKPARGAHAAGRAAIAGVAADARVPQLVGA